jgi:hypothetical protein
MTATIFTIASIPKLGLRSPSRCSYRTVNNEGGSKVAAVDSRPISHGVQDRAEYPKKSRRSADFATRLA